MSDIGGMKEALDFLKEHGADGIEFRQGNIVGHVVFPPFSQGDKTERFMDCFKGHGHSGASAFMAASMALRQHRENEAKR